MQNNHHLDESVRLANDLRHQASKALSNAFASMNKAMISQIDMAIPLWEEALNQADRTQQLWSQVTAAFEAIQVPEILQAHVPKLLTHFQMEAASWTAEIKWRQLRHQAAMVDLSEETIRTLLSTADSDRLNIVADEEAQIMIACEAAADEWVKAEDQTNSSHAVSQNKEYNNLKTKVAANRCKIAVAKKAAEVITILNKAEKTDKKKLQKALESYGDALQEYQQFL